MPAIQPGATDPSARQRPCSHALRWLGPAMLTLLLSACGSTQKNAYIEKPVDDLYNQAMDQMVEERYEQASKTFEDVESQHPYSIWATKSQLMEAYALYEAEDYNQAVIAADRFIQLHPGNQDVAYAYYLKAISYYVQIVDVGRDQKTTELAQAALEDVVRRFPESQYARDASLKLAFVRDHLAGKEMEIGRYYLDRDQYLAAMNRFKRVIEKYQTTTHVPEALERLVECDLALGMVGEAKRNAAVLGYNYPGSEWYGDAYALLKGSTEPDQQTQSWLGRTFGGWF
ncbi:MAG TPA: outer membrane protein assembly factor BamD [Stellaceae bacterium]|nr:outer membrane protein assembly factor BamD [Stellaceae bacterium]